MRRFTQFATAFAAAALLDAGAAGASTITIVNVDGAGEGFNDPTPVAPIGGNMGATLGAQRLNVFQYAANLWGAILPSNVTIRVQARFNPQTCTSTSATLGSAGPVSLQRDFANAPFAGTWYHVALANKLANADLAPAADDISATFNSDLDNQTCLGAVDWYYGFDGNEGTDIDLVAVVLHELGHGLGFSTSTTLSTGALPSGLPDIWTRFLYDNTNGLHWNMMTNGQRAASAVNTGNLAWDGPVTTAAAPMVLGPRPVLRVNSPPAIAGDYQVGQASFGPALSYPGTTGVAALADDGGGDDPNDACEALVNGAALVGKVAIVNRGLCTFAIKVKTVQNAGAIACVIVNNVAGPPVAMGGSDPTITIPAVMVSNTVGGNIIAQLGMGVNLTITVDPTKLAGADNSGRVLMYAPSPIQSGSSVSHFDTSAFPNLLMEPAINSDLGQTTDLTKRLFQDIGWFTGATDTEAPPAVTRLYPASPNPFNPTTTLRFDLAARGAVRLEVHDVRGALVQRVFAGDLGAGRHAKQWDGRTLEGGVAATGVYVARLVADGRTLTQRLVLLK